MPYDPRKSKGCRWSAHWNYILYLNVYMSLWLFDLTSWRASISLYTTKNVWDHSPCHVCVPIWVLENINWTSLFQNSTGTRSSAKVQKRGCFITLRRSRGRFLRRMRVEVAGCWRGGKVWWRRSLLILPLMEEILHHLLSMKPYEKWYILHINWCRNSSVNSIFILSWKWIIHLCAALLDMRCSNSSGLRLHPILHLVVMMENHIDVIMINYAILCNSRIYDRWPGWYERSLMTLRVHWLIPRHYQHSMNFTKVTY